MSQTGFSTNLNGRKIDLTRRSHRVSTLQESFASKIVGQTDAVEAFTDILEAYLGGLRDPGRPIASLLLIGPTGTGKTRTVEALAEGLFGKKEAMIKIDCGEYIHSHEIAKLIGSPPGYLGHTATPPRLTQAAVDEYRTEDMPLSILLFDEIEKACDELWQLLLGILDKGEITLGDNKKTNLKQTLIVMTSNVGAAQMSSILSETKLGFNGPKEDVTKKKLQDVAMSAAKKKFTPEFLNRLDKIVMFNTLTRDDCRKIVDLEIRNLSNRLYARQGSALFVSPGTSKEILERGFSTEYNARSVRRVIEKEIGRPIALAISTGQLYPGEDIVVGYDSGEFSFYARDVKNTWHSQKKPGSHFIAEIDGGADTATIGTDCTPTTSYISPPVVPII